MSEQIKHATPEQQSQEAAIERLRKIIGPLRNMADHNMAPNREISDFSTRLESEYDETTLNDCYLWHVLVGGTFPEGCCGHFDLEGEDSIEKFINYLHAKYIDKVVKHILNGDEQIAGGDK